MLTLIQPPPKHTRTYKHTHTNTVISDKVLETDTQNNKYCKNYFALKTSPCRLDSIKRLHLEGYHIILKCLPRLII